MGNPLYANICKEDEKNVAHDSDRYPPYPVGTGRKPHGPLRDSLTMKPERG